MLFGLQLSPFKIDSARDTCEKIMCMQKDNEDDIIHVHVNLKLKKAIIIKLSI